MFNSNEVDFTMKQTIIQEVHISDQVQAIESKQNWITESLNFVQFFYRASTYRIIVTM